MSSGETENLREEAIRVLHEEENKRKTDPEETHERSIIIIGSKGVGKTTMIYKFLEKDDTPKPTIAMDYSFGRKAGKSLVKDVVHVWEVGHLESSLISAAMTGSSLVHSPHHTTLMVMLDLGKPEVLWSTLEESVAVARSAIRMSYAPEVIEGLTSERVRKKKIVEKIAEPFPMKLCIIGGKYDQFKVSRPSIPIFSNFCRTWQGIFVRPKATHRPYLEGGCAQSRRRSAVPLEQGNGPREENERSAVPSRIRWSRRTRRMHGLREASRNGGRKRLVRLHRTFAAGFAAIGNIGRDKASVRGEIPPGHQVRGHGEPRGSGERPKLQRGRYRSIENSTRGGNKCPSSRHARRSYPEDTDSGTLLKNIPEVREDK